MKFSDYLNKTHTYGRIVTLIAIAIMLGIPAIVCTVYDIWPSLTNVLAVSGPLLALFIPTTFAEFISLCPINGSAGYMGAIMGNVSNIKFPCAISAKERMNVTSGTEEGEVIAMCAMCISGMVTTVIVALGVVLLVPLQPILTTPVVVTATKYIMPALFGSMATSFFISKNAGAYVVEGKVKLVVVVLAAVVMLFLFFPLLRAKSGYVMLCLIPCIVLVARVFYNKGIVKVHER